MGLWTKLRLLGHGDAEPGLEAAEEMLKKDEPIRLDEMRQLDIKVKIHQKITFKDNRSTITFFLAIQIFSIIYIAQLVECSS